MTLGWPTATRARGAGAWITVTGGRLLGSSEARLAELLSRRSKSALSSLML